MNAFRLTNLAKSFGILKAVDKDKGMKVTKLKARHKFTIIAIAIMLVFAPIFMVWRGKSPRKPVDIPLGDYSSTIRYAEQKIQRIMEQAHLPSAAVSLVDDQEIIWQETFGLANMEQDIPAEADTVYKLWSVAKVFTALETMRLVEEGRIDLDAPIIEYLPNFSIQTRFPESTPITVRNILTHRSGLPRNECQWIDLSKHALVDLAASLEDCYQVYPAGYRFKYSNIGFDLLGYLIQEMRGGYFQDYMLESLLVPLGMDNSAFFREQVPAYQDLAVGYEYYKREYFPYEQKDITSFPSGNLYSTIEDMEQFVKFIFRGGDINGKQIINPGTIESMLVEQHSNVRDTQPMSLGWKSAHVFGSEHLIWHDGGPGEGIGSLVALLPKRKLGVVLFANGTEFEGRVSLPLALDLLEVMLKTKYGVSAAQEESQRPLDFDPELLGRYVGKYVAFGEILEVAKSGNQLKGSIQGITFDLVPLGKTLFQPKHWLVEIGLADLFQIPFDLRQMKIEFTMVENQNAESLLINFRDIFFENCPRIPELEELPLGWGSLIGEYDLLARLPSGELGGDVLGTTSIQEKDGVLRIGGWVGPILPISETEIIILSGPFTGETMLVEPGTGNIIHQNIIYQKR